MASTFYLHRELSLVGGTLPSTTADIHTALTPTWTPGTSNSVATTPTLNNYNMDATISVVAQTSLAYLTDNVTTAQQQPLLRWISPLIAAQSHSSGESLSFRFGASHSNSNSAFGQGYSFQLWRPGTGAAVSTICQRSIYSGGTGTSQTVIEIVEAGGDVAAWTSQNGDVLIFELWRDSSLQTMGTSYTNTIFYDGTTNNSTTNMAALIQFTLDVPLYTAAATSRPFFQPKRLYFFPRRRMV